MERTILATLKHYIPGAQFGRYLVVGVWNTLFGYSSYAGLTALLSPRVPHAYMLANVLASLLSITVSFLGYKWFIFKTKGNYLREWTRCVVVYSGGMIAGLVLLPILVFLIRHYARLEDLAPYIAGAILAAINAVAGFLGHRNYSFASKQI